MTHLILLYPGNQKATYDDLTYRISQFSAVVQIEKYCWAVSSGKSADTLNVDLRQYIDRDIDKLLVCEVKCWSHFNFPESVVEKLNR